MTLYTYAARCARVVDGDTIRALFQLGFHVSLEQTVRLLGIDAPETNSPDATARLAAQMAKVRLGQLLPPDLTVIVQTHKTRETDRYGRYLADILLPDGRYVAQVLLAEGLVRAYAGGAR
jgi:micrococcal nuclease